MIIMHGDTLRIPAGKIIFSLSLGSCLFFGSHFACLAEENSVTLVDEFLGCQYTFHFRAGVSYRGRD